MNWITVRYFPIEQDLTALVQFLSERGVQHLITEERGQQLLVVADPAIIPALNQFLDDFEQGRVELPVAAVTSSFEQDRLSFLKNIRQFPLVFTLIVLSVIGALLTNTAMGSPFLHWVTFVEFSRTGYIPLLTTLSQGEVWRLLTPIFLHFGAMHVVFNSLCLWILGRALERYMGFWRFLFLTVIAGIASNLAQYMSSGPYFGGMSGVIYGFVGFMVVMQQLKRNRFPEIPPGLLGFMLFWLVLCMTGVVDVFIAGSVGNASHVGGLVAGVVCAGMTHLLMPAVKKT